MQTSYIAVSEYVNVNGREYQTNKYYRIEPAGLIETRPPEVEDLAYITEDSINPIVRRLSGRVLTAIDAAVPQGLQNKALKDIVKGHIMDAYDEIQRLTDPNNVKGDISKYPEEEQKRIEKNLTEATEEEVNELLFDEKNKKSKKK